MRVDSMLDDLKADLSRVWVTLWPRVKGCKDQRVVGNQSVVVPPRHTGGWDAENGAPKTCLGTSSHSAEAEIGFGEASRVSAFNLVLRKILLAKRPNLLWSPDFSRLLLLSLGSVGESGVGSALGVEVTGELPRPTPLTGARTVALLFALKRTWTWGRQASSEARLRSVERREERMERKKDERLKIQLFSKAFKDDIKNFTCDAPVGQLQGQMTLRLNSPGNPGILNPVCKVQKTTVAVERVAMQLEVKSMTHEPALCPIQPHQGQTNRVCW